MVKIKKIYVKEKGLDESFKPKINTEKNKSLLKHKNENWNKSSEINNNNNNNRFKNIYSNIYIINQNLKKNINLKSEI